MRNRSRMLRARLLFDLKIPVAIQKMPGDTTGTGKGVDWRLTTGDTRIKLKRLRNPPVRYDNEWAFRG